MKYLTLLFASIFIIGCSDTIVSPVTEIEKASLLIVSINIAQEWGWCDTSGCHGVSVSLFEQDINFNLSLEYVFEFGTQDSIVYLDSIPYPLDRFVVLANNIEPFYIESHKTIYHIIPNEITEIELYCNTIETIRIFN